MRLEIKPNGVTVTAPAKINLHLEVLGKRTDGYHDVETIMCPVSLCDRLEFVVTPHSTIELTVELPDGTTTNSDDPAWRIPSDSRNLAVRAIERLQSELQEKRGCRLTLIKNIPAEAGLGGGSSDAAAAVVAAMVGWAKWNRRLANKICAELGSDVNFFLGDEQGIGLGLASGRGEKCLRLDSQPELNICITHPPVGCPTAAVYAGWRPPQEIKSSRSMIAACREQASDQIGDNLHNALMSGARQMTTWIDRQLDLFRQCGCPQRLMSGSGSSCFALLPNSDTMATIRRHAERAGLNRVYAVKSWFAPSVEEQVGLSSSS
jgi:4-diphosphocytidyl-2-C-methyl-D-erythritol kinase